MDPSPDYRSFWPLYLAAHSRPSTRAMHMAGTAAGLLLLLAAVMFRSAWLLAAALIAGYGLAWLSHGLVERNRPATFRHPFWSFFSDLRMLILWLLGRLDSELARYGLDSDGTRN